MKIAMLILAHQNPEMLKRLVRALDDARFDIFIHIDEGSKIEDFDFSEKRTRHSNLFIVPNRIRSRWGDISLFDAMVGLYQYAMEQGHYDWFITLSGEDYPIRSNDEIYEYITKREVDCIGITKCRTEIRYRGFFFWKLGNRFLVKAFRKGIYLLGFKKRKNLIVDGKEWTICLSAQWSGLTRDSVQHILTMLKYHPEIRRYFKYSLAPDEMVIPTILHNAKLHLGLVTVPDLSDNMTFEEMALLHFLEHNVQKDSSVTIYNENYYDEIINSGRLFVRKVRMGKSERLIEMLDKYRG